MPTKPPSPPGLPTVSQRMDAIKLAARHHSKTPKAAIVSKGKRLVLPPKAPTITRDTTNSTIPSVISIPTVESDEDNISERRQISKSTRPRFMRWTSKEMYPSDDDVGVTK